MNLIILSTLNSTAFCGLLYIINSALHDELIDVFSIPTWLVFIFFVGMSLLGSKIFQKYIATLSNNITFEKEMKVIERVKACDYRSYERMGFEKVYTALADSKMISSIPNTLISLFDSIVLTLCCIGFLIWTLPIGALSVIIVIIFLLAIYLYRNKKIQRELNKLRDLQNDYYRYLKDFLYGHRELKTSPNRLESIFYDFLKQNRLLSKELELSTTLKYMNNELTGNFSWYVVFFVVMFIFPIFQNFDDKILTTFLVVLMYLMGPIGNLTGAIPTLTRLKISLERLKQFEEWTNLNDKADTHIPTKESFNNIHFNQVTYTHLNDVGLPKFNFGPINLQIKQGEIVFVTGGNGSGKSTFLNLLIGLYKPETGEVFFNGNMVNNTSVQRENISIIFSDHYLFSENYDGFELGPTNARLKEYINLMSLSDIIINFEPKKILDSRLSRGQQKRLAMIHSLMEDKSLMVFDEWAAEQAPEFKAYFYNELLPLFKNMGKTIVIATHDDRFFKCADRVIEFDFGKIINQ